MFGACVLIPTSGGGSFRLLRILIIYIDRVSVSFREYRSSRGCVVGGSSGLWCCFITINDYLFFFLGDCALLLLVHPKLTPLHIDLNPPSPRQVPVSTSPSTTPSASTLHPQMLSCHSPWSSPPSLISWMSTSGPRLSTFELLQTTSSVSRLDRG